MKKKITKSRCCFNFLSAEAKRTRTFDWPCEWSFTLKIVVLINKKYKQTCLSYPFRWGLFLFFLNQRQTILICWCPLFLLVSWKICNKYSRKMIISCKNTNLKVKVMVQVWKIDKKKQKKHTPKQTKNRSTSGWDVAFRSLDVFEPY